MNEKWRNERRETISMKLAVKHIHTNAQQQNHHWFAIAAAFHTNFSNYRSSRNLPRRLGCPRAADEKLKIKNWTWKGFEYTEFGIRRKAKNRKLIPVKCTMNLWIMNEFQVTSMTDVAPQSKKKREKSQIVNKPPVHRTVYGGGSHRERQKHKFRSHCASNEIQRFGRTQKIAEQS